MIEPVVKFDSTYIREIAQVDGSKRRSMWKKMVLGLKENDEGAQSRQLTNLFKEAILVDYRAPDRKLWTSNGTRLLK